MNQTQTDWSPERMQSHLDSLCKPPGSLGILESVANRLGTIQQTLSPVTRPRHLTIFAADHGVVSEGVTAWPSEVTAAVVDVMQGKRTASGVFAQALECGYEVVDVGLLRPLGGNIIDAAGKRSTRNLRCEPAMTASEFDHAWQVGAQRAEAACDAGNRLLIGGEMGIGNTTSASCLISLLCGQDPSSVVGRGAGIDDQGMEKKVEVVTHACQRVHQIGNVSPRAIACEVGGFEIVALAAFYCTAAKRRTVVLVDGFISTAAAVLAETVQPGTADWMIAGHKSVEPGHKAALDFLGLSPVLDLGMRLGEGTGALAALPLLDLAAAMSGQMATLADLEMP